MILNIISSLISIDKIILKNNGKYVHFVTHLDDLLIVPNDWKSIIYTSRHIAKILSMKKTPIPKKYCRAMTPNEKLTLTLKDGKTIDVIMFTNVGCIGTVMFYFQSSDQKVLYTGPFIRYRSILFNQNFQLCTLSGIDYLFIDNTRANCTDHETIESVSKKVQNIVSEFPGYQIWINVPPFGYEDLIVSFICNCKLKVYVGDLQLNVFKQYKMGDLFTTDPKAADIVIGQESLTMEKIKYRYDRKRLTVRLLEFNSLPNYNNFEKIGLFQFHWSPHPSLFQMYSFIEFVKPKHIAEIYTDMPKIPKFLRDLCDRNNNMDNNLSLSNHITTLPSSPKKVAAPQEIGDVFNNQRASLSNYIRPQYQSQNEIQPSQICSQQSAVSSYMKSRTELPRNIKSKKKEGLQAPIVAVIKPHSAINVPMKLPDYREFVNQSINSSMSLSSTEDLVKDNNTLQKKREISGLDKYEDKVPSKSKAIKQNQTSPSCSFTLGASAKSVLKSPLISSECKLSNTKNSVKIKKSTQRKDFDFILIDDSSAEETKKNDKPKRKVSVKRKRHLSPGKLQTTSNPLQAVHEINKMKTNLFAQSINRVVQYTSDEN